MASVAMVSTVTVTLFGTNRRKNPQKPGAKLVTCHLGNGVSLAAIRKENHGYPWASPRWKAHNGHAFRQQTPILLT